MAKNIHAHSLIFYYQQELTGVMNAINQQDILVKMTENMCNKCGSESTYLVIQQEYKAKACQVCGHEERMN